MEDATAISGTKLCLKILVKVGSMQEILKPLTSITYNELAPAVQIKLLQHISECGPANKRVLRVNNFLRQLVNSLSQCTSQIMSDHLGITEMPSSLSSVATHDVISFPTDSDLSQATRVSFSALLLKTRFFTSSLRASIESLEAGGVLETRYILRIFHVLLTIRDAPHFLPEARHLLVVLQREVLEVVLLMLQGSGEALLVAEAKTLSKMLQAVLRHRQMQKEFPSMNVEILRVRRLSTGCFITMLRLGLPANETNLLEVIRHIRWDLDIVSSTRHQRVYHLVLLSEVSVFLLELLRGHGKHLSVILNETSGRNEELAHVYGTRQLWHQVHCLFGELLQHCVSLEHSWWNTTLVKCLLLLLKNVFDEHCTRYLLKSFASVDSVIETLRSLKLENVELAISDIEEKIRKNRDQIIFFAWNEEDFQGFNDLLLDEVDTEVPAVANGHTEDMIVDVDEQREEERVPEKNKRRRISCEFESPDKSEIISPPYQAPTESDAVSQLTQTTATETVTDENEMTVDMESCSLDSTQQQEYDLQNASTVQKDESQNMSRLLTSDYPVNEDVSHLLADFAPF